MTLGVEVPPPPPIEGRPAEPEAETTWADDPPAGAGRREAIADVLAEGAWADGLGARTEDTHLGGAESVVLRSPRLLDGLDLQWDPDTESVRYPTPAVADAVARELDGDTEEVRAAIEEFAREAVDVVESDHLVREEGVFEFSSGDPDPEFRDIE